MKKPFRIILYLYLVVPVLFIGCKKSEVTDDSQNAKDNSLKSVAYCGSATTANLYSYYDAVKTSYGTVTVGNDLNNVYVTYALVNGWTLLPKNNDVEWFWLNGCYLYIGSVAEVEAMYLGPPPANKVNPDFTGHFNFPIFPNHYTPSVPGETTYQFVIPRSKIKENCPIIVAFAGIKKGTEIKYVSARSLLKGAGYWFTHCIQICGHGSGTAYAYGGALATCFINIPNINSNNWGWTNKIGAGTYDWPIYAGAGQCDITKGTLVGTLHVVYTPPTATITYNMASGVSLGETHLSVFKDPKMLATDKKGNYTTAPGQFPYTGTSVTVGGLSGNIWIAAHSGVTW
jgi:hypothetical protein